MKPLCSLLVLALIGLTVAYPAQDQEQLVKSAPEPVEEPVQKVPAVESEVADTETARSKRTVGLGFGFGGVGLGVGVGVVGGGFGGYPGFGYGGGYPGFGYYPGYGYGGYHRHGYHHHRYGGYGYGGGFGLPYYF